MKIALYDPWLSGHHPDYAAKIVESLYKSGNDVLYLTPDRSERISMIRNAGAEIQYVGQVSKEGPIKSYPGIFTNVRSALQTAIKRDYDIFHHLYIDLREPAITSALSMSSIPILFTLFNPHYDKGSTFIREIYARLCLSSVDLFSQKTNFQGMFVHTPQIKQDIYQQSRFIQYDGIHVIPDPISLPKQHLSKKDARNRLNISDNEVVYLFFGGLRANKGPKLLLNAIENVDRDVSIVIAGSADAIGQEEIETTNRKSQAVLDSRLEFIPESEIYTYFFACDAVLLPYRPDYYGTSGILQRAAATGRPVIATDVGEIGPLTKKHGLGYVVEPDPEAIAQQLESFDLQTATSQFKSNLHRYAERHSTEQFGQKIRTVYRNIDKNQNY